MNKSREDAIKELKEALLSGCELVFDEYELICENFETKCEC